MHRFAVSVCSCCDLDALREPLLTSFSAPMRRRIWSIKGVVLVSAQYHRFIFGLFHHRIDRGHKYIVAPVEAAENRQRPSCVGEAREAV